MPNVSKIVEKLSQPSVRIFVDAEDLAISMDVEEYEDIFDSENKLAILRGILKFSMSLGRIISARAYDDWKQSEDLKPSQLLDMGYTTVQVHSKRDSRIPMVLALDVSESTSNPKNPTIVVIVVGGADYSELITLLTNREIQVVIIGVDSEVPSRMRNAPCVFIPIQQVMPRELRNFNQKLDDFDTDDYDFSDFIRLMDKLENGHMDFVGVRHMIHKILPSIGVRDYRNGNKLIGEAEKRGFLELYHRENIREGENMVTACRLVRENPQVISALNGHSLYQEEEYDVAERG